MSSAWSGGSTRGWRKTRSRVLANNPSGKCRVNVGAYCPRHGRPCPAVCTGAADCVHHPHGKAAGDSSANLQPSCTACNLHIGDPTKLADPRPAPKTKW